VYGGAAAADFFVITIYYLLHYCWDQIDIEVFSKLTTLLMNILEGTR
jgi:hypothetical protein